MSNAPQSTTPTISASKQTTKRRVMRRTVILDPSAKSVRFIPAPQWPLPVPPPLRIPTRTSPNSNNPARLRELLTIIKKWEKEFQRVNNKRKPTISDIRIDNGIEAVMREVRRIRSRKVSEEFNSITDMMAKAMLGDSKEEPVDMEGIDRVMGGMALEA